MLVKWVAGIMHTFLRYWPPRFPVTGDQWFPLTKTDYADVSTSLTFVWGKPPVTFEFNESMLWSGDWYRKINLTSISRTYWYEYKCHFHMTWQSWLVMWKWHLYSYQYVRDIDVRFIFRYQSPDHNIDSLNSNVTGGFPHTKVNDVETSA